MYVDSRLVHNATLTITTETIEVSRATDTMKPDPKWSYVDTQGHYHATSKDNSDPWPTLDVRTTDLWDEEDEEEPVEYNIVRTICGATVEPRMIVDKLASSLSEFEPGHKSCSADFQFVNGELCLTHGQTVSVRAVIPGHSDVFGVGIVAGLEA